MAESTQNRYLVSKPVYETGPGEVEGRQNPAMTFISNALIPESNIYIAGGWIWGMPNPNPHILEHSHDLNEIVLHIGSDPDKPEELGGEIEFVVGGEQLVFNKTSAVFIPAGVKHGPLTWKKFKKPHIEMSILIGGASSKVPVGKALPGE